MTKFKSLIPLQSTQICACDKLKNHPED